MVSNEATQPDLQEGGPVQPGATEAVSLLDLPLERLQGICSELGEPAYRARQIFTWLHERNAASPAQMTDIPAALREHLAEHYKTWPMKLSAKVRSSDDSVKYGWFTGHGDPVEAVLMPGFDYGTSLCVSSQSGCGMACSFCQTGYMGLRSYLSAGEILQQLYESEVQSGISVDRIVFMGMGEPLQNLRAVRRVIDILCGKPGRDWSPKRITVSTVGLVKPMLLMARTFPRVNLALSLHFTTKDMRKEYMPQADHDVNELAEALFFYRQANGGKVTIEYTLMKDINDSEADANRLIRFARLSGLAQDSDLMLEALSHQAPVHQQPLPLHVNIIAYNPIPGAKHIKATPERGINEFARILRDASVPVTVRHSRGQDVSAACGMLGTEMAKAG